MIDKDNIESISGLASMQKGMVFSYVMDTGSEAYVEQFDFTGTGPLNDDLMRKALNALSQHYSVLRTIISFRNTDDPYQIVLHEWPPPYQVLDYRDQLDIDHAVNAFKAADRAQGFTLDADVLIRAALIWVDDQRWHLIITFHHIILDGWSLDPLFSTLFGYYDELVETGSFQQRRETQPYREYIAWYERQNAEDAERHWAEMLEGYEKPATIVTDRHADGYQRATHSFTLPDDVHALLQQFVQREQVTQSAVFLAAWGIVLQKFTYSDDVVFGGVVSGRSIDLDGVEGMLGLLVNTQPVRVTTPTDGKFADLCRTVQESHRRANPYEHHPLHEIQNATPLKNALLDHVVAFENYPLSAQLDDFGSDDTGLRFEAVEVFERTNYDLDVVVNPVPEFTVTFTYNANRYSLELMGALAQSLVRVFDKVLNDGQVPIDDLAAWGSDSDDAQTEPASIETGWLPTDSSLIGYFKDVVARYGDKTALTWRGTDYTYREIDRWSDAVAWDLRRLGAEPLTGVGVMVGRRPEFVAAVLGLLKNGNYYLPIDMKDVSSRIEYVLDDADVQYVCAVPGLDTELPAAVHTMPIEAPPADVAEFPWHRGTAGDVAYLMYTSGSTGQPKGCYVTHRNILRLILDQTYFDFGPEQVVLQTCPPAFDVFTWELWGTILFGATLIQPSEEMDIIDGARMRELIGQHQIRSMWLTSPLFNQMCDQDPTIFAPLRHLLVGGSALSVPHIAKVREANPELRVTNGYGPTENTAFSTTHEIEPEDLLRDRIPIGRALNHSTAYVLDRGLNSAPPGAVGELCVGGEGVALGYHNRPDLTSARFLTLPQFPGERLYRTGDLARLMPDGNVDYIGRTDDQVKVNGGFRVELGEVETVLNSLDRIEDAVVIAVEHGGGKELAAYYVADGTVTPNDVRQELASKLASYMVPVSVVATDKIPLNKNGKVDRIRLEEARLESETRSEQSDREILSSAERAVRDVVSSVIGSDDVDISRNFFDIGVTSLSMVAINNRLRKLHDLDLPMTAYFEHTSIAALASHIDTILGGSESSGTDDEVFDFDDAALMTNQALTQLVDDSEGTH